MTETADIPKRKTLPAICKTKVANCYICLTLDIRNECREPDGVVPVCIRFTIERTRYYIRLPERFSRDDYLRIVNSSGRGRKSEDKETFHDIRVRLEKEYLRYLRHLEELSHVRVLTIPLIKTMATGMGGELSFLSIWEQEALKKTIGTKLNYLSARNSFIKYVGEIPGFKITVNEIKQWVRGMQDDGMSQTTIGIYERACRVIWNVCQDSGYISRFNYPFGKGISSEKIRIPRGASRKKSWLNVKKMTRLYEVFINREYPGTWGESFKKRVEVSLGLFLMQYLGNGMNLADVAYITYSDSFFQEEDRSLQFFRRKTKGRSIYDDEIIIPVTKQLDAIIHRIGAEPAPGKKIFPFILKDEQDEAVQHRLIIQENQNIRKRMSRLTKSLGWAESPTSTWARHSFATNLTHAGVPLRYISQSMGHSAGENVTARYIDNYPVEQQMYYNSLLLAEGVVCSVDTDKYQKIIRLIRQATPEQIDLILKVLG